MLKKMYQYSNSLQQYTNIDLHYLFKNGGWLTIGQLFASTSSLVVTAVFANFVDPQTFGTYKYVIAAVGLFAITTLRGLNISYTQAVARGHEGSYRKILRMKILWGFAGTLASMTLGLYYLLQDNVTLGIVFFIAAVFIPFYETLNLYGNLLSGRKHFKLATKYFVLARLISVPFLIATILLTNNIAYILIAYFLPISLIQYIIGKKVEHNHPPNESADSKVISYGKHLSLIGVFSNSMRYFDSILLFTMVSAPALAVYTLATAAVDQVSGQYKNLSSLMMPKLAKKTGIEIHRTFYKRLLFIGLLSSVLTFIYVLLIPYAFKIIFPLYPEAVYYAQILSGVLFLSLVNAFLGGIIQSRLDITPKKFLYWRITPRIIFIISLFILVPVQGVLGVVISRTLQSITTTMIRLIQYYKLYRIER